MGNDRSGAESEGIDCGVVGEVDVTGIACAVGSNGGAKGEDIAGCASCEATTTGDGLGKDASGIDASGLDGCVVDGSVNGASVCGANLCGAEVGIAADITNPAATTTDRLEKDCRGVIAGGDDLITEASEVDGACIGGARCRAGHAESGVADDLSAKATTTSDGLNDQSG